jgi:uncharacterized protein YegL
METILIILLDESGSMNQHKIETIETFNNLINEQKKLESDQTLLYFLTFNTEVKTRLVGIKLKEVTNLTENDYKPNGLTALYDAIAESINKVDQKHKKGERIICLIITDGQENASKNTKLKDIKKMIKSHESEGNWTFIYVGVDPEGWKENSGSSSQNSISFDKPDSCGITSTAILNFRKTSSSQTSNIFKC